MPVVPLKVYREFVIRVIFSVKFLSPPTREYPEEKEKGRTKSDPLTENENKKHKTT